MTGISVFWIKFSFFSLILNKAVCYLYMLLWYTSKFQISHQKDDQYSNVFFEPYPVINIFRFKEQFYYFVMSNFKHCRIYKLINSTWYSWNKLAYLYAWALLFLVVLYYGVTWTLMTEALICCFIFSIFLLQSLTIK